MKTATTREFRDAVHRAVGAVGLHYSPSSWTEAPQGNLASDKRYVGFRCDYGSSKAVAEIAEEILNLSGLTAHTRLGKERALYVRGTCVKA
jgi:hypothetical protein